MSNVIDEADTYSCNVVDGCLIYLVYCAIEIPPSKISLLDDLVLSSRRGLANISEPPESGPVEASSALFFMHSDVPGTMIERGAHVPMQPFPSYPYAEKSLEWIYHKHRGAMERYLKEANGNRAGVPLAIHNFAIIDKRTLKDKTILLCSDSRVELDESYEGGKKPIGIYGEEDSVPEGLATIRSDGFGSLHLMVPDEMGISSLRIGDKRDSFVYTEGYSNYKHANYVAKIQAKIARGEPLRKIEELTSGLKDPSKRREVDDS